MLITLVLLGLAVQSQLSTGHIESNLLTVLGVLGAGWAGWGVDRVFPK